jgi:hypothetical protein
MVSLLVLLAACSSSNDQAPPFDATTGKHPVGWLQEHPLFYIASPGQCLECHGDILDPSGGISRVSCASASFNGNACHAGGPGHLPGFADPAVHGVRAKGAATGSNGFSYCQLCHGVGFAGSGRAPSCFDCHGVPAPHPSADWRTTGAYTHITTDESNAPVCGQCHYAGANFSGGPITVTPGTPAGCFNNSLCHGVKVKHTVPFLNHYLTAGTGSTCTGCHANSNPAAPYPAGTSPNFTAPDCQACHNKAAPGVGCRSCHGDATTTRPVGTTFPDDANRHNNPGQHATACAICHAGGGSGVVTHGNSNHVVKTRSNVTVVFSGGAVDMTFSRDVSGNVTCNGTCHTPDHTHSNDTW